MFAQCIVSVLVGMRENIGGTRCNVFIPGIITENRIYQKVELNIIGNHLHGYGSGPICGI